MRIAKKIGFVKRFISKIYGAIVSQ